MEPHEWLAFFHVLAAIIWVGAVIFMNAMMALASRGPDRTAVLRLAHEFQRVGPLLMGPSFLVVVGSGIWLVALEDWAAFSQLWVWLALVLVAVSMLLSIYSGSQRRRMSRAAAERGAEESELLRGLRRNLWLSRLDMLVLVFVVWLMVLKPGV